MQRAVGHFLGVVNQNVQAAQGIDGLLDAIFQGIYVLDITNDGQAFAAPIFDFLTCVFQLLQGSPRNGNFCTLCGQRKCNTLPNALAGTGNKSDFSS